MTFFSIELAKIGKTISGGYGGPCIVKKHRVIEASQFSDWNSQVQTRVARFVMEEARLNHIILAKRVPMNEVRLENPKEIHASFANSVP